MGCKEIKQNRRTAGSFEKNYYIGWDILTDISDKDDKDANFSYMLKNSDALTGLPQAP